ncbi:uncharacterized protein EMH_0068020 [Eimeria mitis]|uniref:Copper transport protein n=1 Tax=Eimeria mitis TaxID=44415 RepID=U6KHB0_9EIME|nr:uncharacterized protein EMH_0068020 [Eimeria mitis]CDJ34828.1 hypothetical protein, conserved [Eimeria mitis]
MEMQMTFYWGYDAIILFPWWQTSTAVEFYLSCVCIFALCLVSAKLKAVCCELQRGDAHAAAPTRPAVREVCSEGSVETASGGSNEMNGLPSVMTTASDRWPAAPPLLQGGGLQSLYSLHPGSWTRVSVSSPTEGSHRCLKAKPLAVCAISGRMSFVPHCDSLHAIRSKSYTEYWTSHSNMALLCIAVAIDWGMMLVCMTFNAGLFCAVVGGVATGQLLNKRGAPRGGDCCSGTAHS